MLDLYLLLALLGGLTLGLGLVAGTLQRRPGLPAESILAVAFGVLVGPDGLDVLPLGLLGDPLAAVQALALLTVAFAVTSIALRLPTSYLRDQAASLAALVGPGMVAMWLTGAGLAHFLLGVAPWVALLIGAAVTPTDPVLANSIVAGSTATEHIPARLRHLLSAEAGVNDGAAHPLVFLAVIVLVRPPETALTTWASEAVLLAVLGGVAFGAAVGGGVGWLECRFSGRGRMEETSVFTVAVALTVAVLGAAELVGVNGILAVFAAGAAYNWRADPADETREQRIEEVFNRLFTIPVFVVFGALLPWGEWSALGWRGVALLTGILLLRRLPAVLALARGIGSLERPADALFVGWFGPIGIAALYYATVAVGETGETVVWPVVSLVVAGSILVHGGTATGFALWYDRATGDDAES